MRNIVIYLCIGLTGLGSSLAHAEFLSKLQCDDKSRYCMVNLTEHAIFPQNPKTPNLREATLIAYVRDEKMTVQYDRPSTRLDETSVTGLLNYLKCPTKKDLLMTLMLRPDGAPRDIPFVFQVTSSSYSAERRMMVLQVVVKDCCGYDVWEAAYKKNGSLRAGESVLMLEG